LIPRFSWPRKRNASFFLKDKGLPDRIIALADEFAPRRDSQLAAMLSVIRRELQAGADVVEPRIFQPVFALVFEAIRRTTSMRLYPVQLQAGCVLAFGMIAEMKTGEGKTIVVALPAVLRALEGRGVHVATVNAYLAERDFALLAPAYALLGLSAGLLKDGADPPAKHAAYACDITYGTGYEFGFDYLRDQLQHQQIQRPKLGESFRNRLQGRIGQVDQRLQKKHGFAIVDEADSVLLDEANTPLVISQGSEEPRDTERILRLASYVASGLKADTHFLVRPRERTITILNAGHSAIFGSTDGVPNQGLQRPWICYVENALRAQHVLRRDVDFVVQEKKVQLVDPHTGRIFSDRSWQNGLHQAVECEAGVPITPEKNSSARISRQRYFRLYEQLCGMTGTASGQEKEFKEFYGLDVVVIPERLPCQRRELPTRYFPTEDSKLAAIVQDVVQRHSAGQPILLGTSTIQESERLSALLYSHGLDHQVLNGKQDASEADLVATAGHAGAITVATNMAGRGTDISLTAESRNAGGLHVIATQRQQSRRIDRQLIGRSGRQGDVGSSQVYVSADDDLLVRFSPALCRKLCTIAEPEGIQSRELDRRVLEVQQTSEVREYRARRDLWYHDQWMNKILVAVADRDHGARCEVPVPSSQEAAR
jgi:preprotein translocase subunit SecA